MLTMSRLVLLNVPCNKNSTNKGQFCGDPQETHLSDTYQKFMSLNPHSPDNDNVIITL